MCGCDGVSLQSDAVSGVRGRMMCDQLAALRPGSTKVGTWKGSRHSLVLRPLLPTEIYPIPLRESGNA